MKLTKEQKKEILEQVKEQIENQLLDYLYKVEHKHIILYNDRKLVVENLKLLKEINKELND